MEELESSYRVNKLWEAKAPEQLVERWAEAIRAIATRAELGASRGLIERLPNLEIIACYGVGTDAIDLETAKQRNIRVTNTPQVLNKDVADMAIALMLAVLRQIPQGDRYIREGRWITRNMDLCASLTGKAVGILGYGRIGEEVAKRASAFDTTVAYCNRVIKAESAYKYFPTAKALAEACDVLIVTVSGGPATRHIVNSDVLRALGPQGVLINVSRGSTVDEDALIDALEKRVIAGAGLDVFANEPNIDPRFLRLDNLLVQPHHASGTVKTRKAMGQLVRDNLAAHFLGKPLLTPVL
jgi:D-3-phosphoglycerate dehydrogenase